MRHQPKRYDPLLVISLAFLLVLLLGPFVLLAYPLQRWAGKQIWDAEDRWDTLWCFAICGWIAYLPSLVFRVPLAHAWQQVALLGPATLSAFRFRSCVMFFLVPTVTLLLERFFPKTHTVLLRVRFPGDKGSSPPPSAPPALNAAPAEKKQKTTRAPEAKEKAASTPAQTERKPRSRRDPHPIGEVLYDEKHGQQQKAQQRAAAPESPAKSINWDEGEGTYTEH
jgi:hypothetical protein